MLARFLRFQKKNSLAGALPGKLYAGILILLAISAMVMLYSSTPAGVGLSNDSAAYIAGARSILQGTGYSDIWLDSALEPITHYPPLLSLSLAAMSEVLRIDPLRGARILNILLFGSNTALMGLLGWQLTRSLDPALNTTRNIPNKTPAGFGNIAGLWLAALFSFNPAMLRIHIFALSEPLFIFLSLLSFLFFDFSQTAQQVPGYSKGTGIVPSSSEPKRLSNFGKRDGQKKLFWLAMTGITIGLAFLTRYSALALIPTFSILLLLFQKNGRARLANISILLSGAFLAMAAWLIRNKLAAGNITNRTFQYHPITSENITPGIYNISQFLIPVEPWRAALVKSGGLIWILAGLGLALFIWLSTSIWTLLFQSSDKPDSQPQILQFGIVLYTFAYIGAILFSMGFFDASTKFQPRILAPIYITFMMLIVIFGVQLWRIKNLVLHACVIGLIIISLAFSISNNFQEIANYKEAGQGYASWKWHDSLIMASLSNLPPEIAIYTNSPPAVYLVTGKASRVIPTSIDPVDNLARSDYQQNRTEMRSNLLAGRAVLALFDTSNIDDALGTQNGDTTIPGLKILQKTQGDILFGLDTIHLK